MFTSGTNKQFQDGRDIVELNVVYNRSKLSNDEQYIEEIEDLVLQNRRLTIRDLADTAAILKDVLGFGPQTHLISTKKSVTITSV